MDCPKSESTSSVTSQAQNITTVPVNGEKTSNNHFPDEYSTGHPTSSERNSKAPHIDSKITTIIFICAGIVIAVILGFIVVYFMFKNSKYPCICFAIQARLVILININPYKKKYIVSKKTICSILWSMCLLVVKN